jgi:hypothetical protein
VLASGGIHGAGVWWLLQGGTVSVADHQRVKDKLRTALEGQASAEQKLQAANERIQAADEELAQVRVCDNKGPRACLRKESGRRRPFSTFPRSHLKKAQ